MSTREESEGECVCMCVFVCMSVCVGGQIERERKIERKKERKKEREVTKRAIVDKVAVLMTIRVQAPLSAN